MQTAPGDGALSHDVFAYFDYPEMWIFRCEQPLVLIIQVFLSAGNWDF
jgi:hypothetical protein